MIGFWQRFKAAWRCAAFTAYDEQADAADYWTEEDAKATAHFFNSYSGRKLGKRLTNYVIKMALAAVQNADPATTSRKNGEAIGVSLAIAAIEMHYPQEKPEVEGMTQLNAMEAAEA